MKHTAFSIANKELQKIPGLSEKYIENRVSREYAQIAAKNALEEFKDTLANNYSGDTLLEIFQNYIQEAYEYGQKK